MRKQEKETHGAKQSLDLALAYKLASIVVHADEMLGPDGHHFDRIALEQLICDPSVRLWIKSLGALAPVSRTRRFSDAKEASK